MVFISFIMGDNIGADWGCASLLLPSTALNLEIIDFKGRSIAVRSPDFVRLKTGVCASAGLKRARSGAAGVRSDGEHPMPSGP